MWGLAYQTWPIYNSSSETKTTSTSPEVQSCPLLFPQNIYHTETSDSLCRIILIWYQVVGKGAGHEAGSLGTTMRSRRRHTFGYFLHRSRPHHSWLCWIHSCALPTEEGNTQSNKEMTRFLSHKADQHRDFLPIEPVPVWHCACQTCTLLETLQHLSKERSLGQRRKIHSQRQRVR